MECISYPISGLKLLKPMIFSDERGYFYESYNAESLEKAGINAVFRQDNQSLSRKHVLRGLHFQKPPYEQGKLVRVVKGSVLDVAVDIRRNSPTYGEHIKVELSADNHHMLWIPPGFAHGFIAMEEDTIFLYKCTNMYHKDAESGIIWNDPDLRIDWGHSEPIISAKDLQLPRFNKLEALF